MIKRWCIFKAARYENGKCLESIDDSFKSGGHRIMVAIEDYERQSCEGKLKDAVVDAADRYFGSKVKLDLKNKEQVQAFADLGGALSALDASVSEEHTRGYDTYSCGCRHPGGMRDRTFEVPCPNCYEASRDKDNERVLTRYNLE